MFWISRALSASCAPGTTRSFLSLTALLMIWRKLDGIERLRNCRYRHGFIPPQFKLSSPNPIRSVKVPPISTATKITQTLQMLSHSSSRAGVARRTELKLRRDEPMTIPTIPEPLNAVELSPDHQQGRQG